MKSRDKALQVWRRRILRRHSRLVHFHQGGAPLLEQIYVEPQLDPRHLPGFAVIDRAALDEVRPEARFLSRRLSIRQVLDLDPAQNPWISRRWLLRGAPGSGKTTLLRHLAWSLADAGGEPWMPVFESLPRLSVGQPSLFGRIEEDLDRAGQPGAEIRRVLEQQAEQGRLLLLLDGLDEVPRQARDRAETLLSELAAKWPKSPIVATTRPIGAWSPGPEFLELEVLPFNAVRRRGLLDRWFGRHGARTPERAASVAGVVEADPGLRELACNPLYLTLTALLIEGGKEPERYRSKLFDQIFDLLEEGRHHRPPRPIDNRAAAHLGLCRLAYRMTEDNRDAEDATALEQWLLEDEKLRQLLGTGWPNLRSYLDDVAEKTGILGDHDGPEAGWRFWHRTFREALSAEWMAKALEDGRRGASGNRGGRWGWEWIKELLRRLWQRIRGRGMPGLLRHAQRITQDELSRWAEPYALLAGRVAEPDALIKALVKENRPLGLRALATVQGLEDETLDETLELSKRWQERRAVYQRLPELIDEPSRALALLDRLRRKTRNGNDLYFLERTIETVVEKWPDARSPAEQLRARLYDHIPAPPEELFEWIETRDGRVELWRRIPAGSFLIGSPEGEKGSLDSERPQHQVVMRSPFRMGAVPVTVAQYASFEPEHGSYQGRAEKELGLHPVEGVTWYQAYAFCRWLSSLLPEGQNARLPTEEEWEYACRAGSETRYWQGDDESDLEKVGWYAGNSGGRTHRVGRKPANAWGLYDVHGNVWEWTSSEWRANYSGRRAGGVRVFRGGSCWNGAWFVRSACRGRNLPQLTRRIRGFRVLLTAARGSRS